ncbi:M56 family metallopeptidase [Rhizohabitans arisaemae]|uniref:M56 family metallopeptidase n=1 Tax=Rhizohabitans arisaemae TaxID=2720610 RepID=UPI0024B1D75D|nr:M56 family metallopeptidase [Rhizohabitans arisaemae]
MITALALTVLAIVCGLVAEALVRARWPWQDPRPAIILWQSVGLTWGLATTGALLGYGLAPYGESVASGLVLIVTGRLPFEPYPSQGVALSAGLTLLSLLIAVMIVATVQVIRARRRHRLLLSLVGRGDPGVPGVLVLDHPSAAAYCVPGLRSQVVISAGTLRLLEPAELTAVLAHEMAHGRERHDLVALPFAALRRALPWSDLVREAQSSVDLLIEMCADDWARRTSSPRLLATALLRFGAAGGAPVPQGALGMGAENHAVITRVNRLLVPAPALPRSLRLAILIVSFALTISAPILWLIPT